MEKPNRPLSSLWSEVYVNQEGLGGKKKDPKMGFSSLDSAEKGWPDAMKKVAKCYQKGYGTEKNTEAANEWLQKANKPIVAEDFKF